MHPSRRKRGISLAIGVSGLLMFVLFILPLPSATQAQGVIWVADEARLTSGVDGFVKEIKITNGASVQQGQVLIIMGSISLEKEKQVLVARLKEFQARYYAGLQQDRAQALVLKEEISFLEAELQRANERLSALQIKSPLDGVALIPELDDLAGRFLRRGVEIGYILDERDATVRVVVEQDDIEQVRHHTQALSARLANAPMQTRGASLLREVPAASNALPSLALSLEGGGNFALDPAASSSANKINNPTESIRVLSPLFQFDLSLPGTRNEFIGERVYIRFEHPSEAIGQRLWRELRRLFLRRFNV